MKSHFIIVPALVLIIIVATVATRSVSASEASTGKKQLPWFLYCDVLPKSHKTVIAGGVPDTSKPDFDKEKAKCKFDEVEVTFGNVHLAHIALLVGNKAAFDAITAKKSDWPTLAATEGFTLHYAAAWGGSAFGAEVLENLLPLPLPGPIRGGYTIVMAAAQGGSVDTLKVVLENIAGGGGGGNNKQHQQQDGTSTDENAAAVKALAAKTKDGVTAFLLAAKMGKIDVMDHIAALHPGAVSDKMQDGSTAAHLAAFGGSVDALEWISSHPASLSTNPLTDDKNRFGSTVFHVAAAGGHVPVLRFLISKGCEVNVKDNDGFTPAMMAATSGRVEAIKFIHESGGNLAAESSDRTTAATIAAESNYAEVLDYVLGHGGFLSFHDVKGRRLQVSAQVARVLESHNKEDAEAALKRKRRGGGGSKGKGGGRKNSDL